MLLLLLCLLFEMIVDSQEVARIVQRGPMSPYPGVTFFYQCYTKISTPSNHYSLWSCLSDQSFFPLPILLPGFTSAKTQDLSPFEGLFYLLGKLSTSLAQQGLRTCHPVKGEIGLETSCISPTSHPQGSQTQVWVRNPLESFLKYRPQAPCPRTGLI